MSIVVMISFVMNEWCSAEKVCALSPAPHQNTEGCCGSDTGAGLQYVKQSGDGGTAASSADQPQPHRVSNSGFGDLLQRKDLLTRSESLLAIQTQSPFRTFPGYTISNHSCFKYLHTIHHMVLEKRGILSSLPSLQ